MSFNRKSKPVSKIVAILIIAILFSTITISILTWNYDILGSHNDNVESDFSFEEPTSPQPNSEPEILNEKPTELQEPTEPEQPTIPEEPPEPNENPTTPPPSQLEWAQIRIGEKNFFFNPAIVNTTRPDLFNKGQFSMFDILVHLKEQNRIELEYHFDETKNTHMIDTIDGEKGWWYIVYYSGGWSEQNVFRPDHYPWKVGTNIRFYKESNSRIAEVYSEWGQEIERRENNNGTIIIPEVIIRGNSFTKQFKDVEVTPHNLRNDTFQENVITAIDVILSLTDQGKITCELQWYDSIGTASTVRSYWVEEINEDKAYGRCGFVYEAGSQRYSRFRGNHIHLPSDFRILNSPEYVEYFWICI